MIHEDKNLILVSNAEPYAHNWEEDEIVCEKLAGGLTSALDPLMRKNKGTWIAWGRGDADFEVSAPGEKILVPEEGEEQYELKRIKLTDSEKEKFYYGFSNEILWPISHSFLQRTILSDYKSTREKWKKYREVNRKYAEAAIEEISSEDDLIWVHDYHLTLVPRMIKEKKPNANIAVFWHIPWPGWNMFGNLPWREHILEGLLGSDFIGFHTDQIKDKFLECVEMIGKEVENNNIESEKSGKTKVGSIPIGIDYDLFNSLSNKEEMKKETKKLRKEFRTENIVLSVDRLDYTKGIPQRLEAFELFLKKYPKFREKVTLVQRIPPSRSNVKEYQSTLEKINRRVGEINGEFEEAGWTPIKSFHRYLPRQEMLIPYYKAADIALLTPLKDGMNLVSKEYIACSEDGVLVLSEFAGAAERLEEAIQVNPYDSPKVAEALKKAIEMPEEERKDRLNKLKEKVRKEDLEWWRNKFLNKWLESI